MPTPLYETYGRIGEPTRHERGFVEARLSRDQIESLIGQTIGLWRSPDVGPEIAALLAHAGLIDGEFGEPPDDPTFSVDDIADMLSPEGATLSADDVGTVFQALMNAEAFAGHAGVPFAMTLMLTAEAIDPARRDKPRLVGVPKDVAMDFVRVTHSQLPELRAQGFLYAIGVAVGERLVAVATVNTPSGPFRNPDRVVDLSRIASDGSVRGASSMLAARVIDLLARAGRNGPGTLLVTYSLLDEAGTTYLALADKGLRPTRYSAPKRAGGARRLAGDTTALRDAGKIVWEAGPDAAAPDWSLLERTPATPQQVAGARKSFELWQARQRRPNPVYSFSEAKQKREAAHLARQALRANHLTNELFDVFELFGFPDVALGEAAGDLFADTVVGEIVRRALRRRKRNGIIIVFDEAKLVVYRRRAEVLAGNASGLRRALVQSILRHGDVEEAEAADIAQEAIRVATLGRAHGSW